MTPAHSMTIHGSVASRLRSQPPINLPISSMDLAAVATTLHVRLVVDSIKCLRVHRPSPRPHDLCHATRVLAEFVPG
jgi:hypothetical protein